MTRPMAKPRAAETMAPEPAEPLDAAVERIRDARAAIEKLQADRARCQAVAVTGEACLQEAQALRVERQEVQARALADGIEDLEAIAAVDARIAAHARARLKELDEAEAARQAIAILDTRLAAAGAHLDELLDAWRGHCEAVILARLDEAEERYAQALDAIAAPLAQLEALAAMYERLYHRALPASGRNRMRETLRGVGALRVVWTHSALADPEVASRYDPATYREGDGLHARFQPAWLAEDNEDFAQAESDALGKLLRVDDVSARA